MPPEVYSIIPHCGRFLHGLRDARTGLCFWRRNEHGPLVEVRSYPGGPIVSQFSIIGPRRTAREFRLSVAGFLATN